MNPSEQPSTSQSSAETPLFSMGQNTQKKNTTLAGKSAEQRMQETFNTGANQGESTKRQREEYSIQLRKDKREQMLKKKRGEAKPAPQQTLNPLEQQMNKASLDEAITMSQTMGVQEFVALVDHLVFRIEDFQRLLTLIMSDKEIEVLIATVGFRRLLSFEDSPPLQPVIDANLVPHFIKLLSHGALPKLQFEACWCLTNLASGSSEHVQILLEKGIVNDLRKLLDSPHAEIVEQAIWAIGNLAGDNAHVRDIVMSAGVVAPICEKLDQAPAGSSFVRNASWTLSNFCRGRPGPSFDYIERAIPSLVKVLVENHTEDIIVDVCWALSYTSDGGEKHIEKIIQSGGLKRLIECLNTPSLAVTISCLRTLGNILTGDDNMVNLAIDAGVLEALHTVMMHNKTAVRKEACWSVSNITAGNADQVKLCIDSGIVDQLVHLLMQDSIEIKKEAVWALSNTTANATPEQF